MVCASSTTLSAPSSSRAHAVVGIQSRALSADLCCSLQVFLASTSGLSETSKGRYFDDLKVASTSFAAQKDGAAEELWSKSEALTGFKWKLGRRQALQ